MRVTELAVPFAAALLITACGAQTEANDAASDSTADAAQSSDETAMDDADAVDPTGAISGVYQTDPTHAYITFSYWHQGLSRPMVRWDSWTGELNWDADEPTNSSIDVVIDVASVDSGVDKFDEHLRSADFFNASEYPEITFKSTALTQTGPNAGTLTGDLTIKNITKPVTLDVKLNDARDAGEEYKIGFSASGQVKRSDFDVDMYTPYVGDDVELIIETEFVLPKEGE